MTEISTAFTGQTVITTFEMTPATAHDVMERLQLAYDTVIRHQPGFLGAGLHMNDAMTRICNYSKWQRREDYQAMLRTRKCVNATAKSPASVRWPMPHAAPIRPSKPSATYAAAVTWWRVPACSAAMLSIGTTRAAT